MNVANWILVDSRPALEGDEDGPTIAITSSEQLRDVLLAHSGQTPGIYYLKNTKQGTRLKIGLSAELGCLHWSDGRSGLSGPGLPDEPLTNKPRFFQLEGAAEEIVPDELLPIEDVVGATVFFFQWSRLSPSIRWQVWHPAENRWEEIPKSG